MSLMGSFFTRPRFDKFDCSFSYVMIHNGVLDACVYMAADKLSLERRSEKEALTDDMPQSMWFLVAAESLKSSPLESTG